MARASPRNGFRYAAGATFTEGVTADVSVGSRIGAEVSESDTKRTPMKLFGN